MKKRMIAVLVAAVAGTPWITGAREAGNAPAPEEQKAEDLRMRALLEERVSAITADPAQHEAAMAEGRERAATCKYCHGEDGNSIKEGTPSIAGQSPVYIVDQFQRYGDDRRYDPWMANLAKTFSQEDKIKLALYFSEQDMKPQGGGDPALMGRGKELFETLCVECHGSDGKGKEGYARLAGQRPEYTVKMLKEFKTPTGHRYNTWMFARANMISTEQDMLAIATYVASLD